MRKYMKFLPVLVFAASITSCVNEDKMLNPAADLKSAKAGEKAVLSNTIDVDLGGPTEPNSVYIDLSTGTTTIVRRDTWELGFYNGKVNRVFLNASILVTAAKTEFTDIDAVNKKSRFSEPMHLKTTGVARTVFPTVFPPREVTVSTVSELLKGLPLAYGMYGNLDEGILFTDTKEGTLGGTALGKIPNDPSQAKVFIVSAGDEIPKEGISVRKRSIKTHQGDYRPDYKIKVFMKNGDYVIQYALLDAHVHNEAVIAKDNRYNLSFFSFSTGQVKAAPLKKDFDINFAGVFSYYGSVPYPFAKDTYYDVGVTYSDYALTNNLGGTGVYSIHTQKWDEATNTYVPTNEIAYEDFTKGDVIEDKFVYNDRSVIDSHWRRPFPPQGVIPGVYYIIKDSAKNIYKLKFTAFMNEKKERGYPQFEYKLLKPLQGKERL